MKNVLCYIDELGSGGAERQITSLAVLLNKNGYKVRVFCYHPNYFYENTLIENNIELIKVELKKNNYINKIQNTWRVVSKYNFDTIIAYSKGPVIIASLIKLLKPSLNVIVSERNTTQKLTFKDKVRFFLFRFVNSIVINSHSQTDFLRTNYPHLTSNTYTITNFIDIEKFHPSSNFVHNSIFRFIVVARHSIQKNVPIFIEAINLLKNSKTPFIVDWYGEDGGGNKQEHINLVNEYGIGDRLIFHHSASNIEEYYRQADAFCLPSLYEGFPNVLCEAMSSGLPIICSNVCDNPMLIDDNINGFLFDPQKPEDIAEAILKIVNMPQETRIKMGILNREKAEKIFSEKNFVAEYVKLIENK